MKAAVCFWVLCGCLWTWDGNGLFAVSLINYAKEKKLALFLPMSRSLRPLRRGCCGGGMQRRYFQTSFAFRRQLVSFFLFRQGCIGGFEGRTATAGNLAFPFSPSDHQLDGKTLCLLLNSLPGFACKNQDESRLFVLIQKYSKIA